MPPVLLSIQLLGRGGRTGEWGRGAWFGVVSLGALNWGFILSMKKFFLISNSNLPWGYDPVHIWPRVQVCVCKHRSTFPPPPPIPAYLHEKCICNLIYLFICLICWQAFWWRVLTMSSLFVFFASGLILYELNESLSWRFYFKEGHISA